MTRLPVLEVEPPRRGPDRRLDRRITTAGLVATILFLLAAVLSLALPAGTRLGSWLPLHLALAGGAGTAIAAMVPFFVAALVVAPPSSPVVRAGSIGLVVIGGTLAAVGRAVGSAEIAAVGAWLDVAGFAGTGLATAWPLRHAAGPRRRLTEAAYLLAIANVLAGITLAALFLGGTPEIGASWGALKPAHGWLNVFGFVTLVIAGTLVHFAPTVAGSRIRGRPAGVVAIAGLAAGAPAVALGYAAGAAWLAQAGALATLAGATALAAHGLQAHGDRAGWTTERAWHSLTAGSLLLAPVWLVVAAASAAARIVTLGVDPAGWRVAELLGPLVIGFVGQVLVGALSFLVTTVSPGPPDRHARQRSRLGRLAVPRLLGLNAGAALLTISGFLANTAPAEGSGLARDALGAGGLLLAIASIGGTLVLLAGALLERDRPAG